MSFSLISGESNGRLFACIGTIYRGLRERANQGILTRDVILLYLLQFNVLSCIFGCKNMCKISNRLNRLNSLQYMLV